jgi:hypothetical protein
VETAAFLVSRCSYAGAQAKGDVWFATHADVAAYVNPFDLPVTKIEAIYKSHLGERSSDLKMLPIASLRQCQGPVFAFAAVVPSIFLGSFLLAC